MKIYVPVAKEVLPFFITSAIITCVFFKFSLILGIIGILSVYILCFFRDPNRPLNRDENNVISPADGTVIAIEQIKEDSFFADKVWKISIFMSLFNVHRNYAPQDGTVAFLDYHKGKFLPADSPESTLVNEHYNIGFSLKSNQKIMVRQIAGIIARRIVCYCKMNEDYKQGDKIGLIRFGSRVEVFMPVDWNVNVKIGDKVKGRISVLGTVK